MRLFKFRKLQKWAKDEGALDAALIEVLKELEQGLFEANLVADKGLAVLI